MLLDLGEEEAAIVHELLEQDLKDLLRDIARADRRDAKEALRHEEEVLQTVLERLTYVSQVC